MYRLVVAVIFLLFPNVCVGDDKKNDTFSMPPILMQSTFKIECQGSLGTGFVLGHNSTNKKGSGHYVLITAKHVLDGFKDDNATIHLRRKVGKKYERILHKIRIRNQGKPLWISHPTADVAVMKLPVPKNSNIRTIGVLSSALLANDEIIQKYEVQPGDELMVLGFPFGVESNESGFPILRSGRIASYPLIPTHLTQSFLLDFEVFRGNSGGPVFIYDKNRFYQGEQHLGRFRFILGLVSQERDLTEKVKSLEQVTIKRHRLALAVIVHAKLIRETVELLFPEDPIPEPTVIKEN